MTGYEATKPRQPIMATYNSPGPANYTLPSTVGFSSHDVTKSKNPSWKFGVRHTNNASNSSPGPIYLISSDVTRNGKGGTPSYSQQSRPKTPRSFKPPGAGTYSPEQAGPSASPRAPAYTMGARTRMRKEDKNPAPNNYSLPSLLGKTVEAGKDQAPRFSIHGRPKNGGFDEDLKKTPGPGNYNVTDPNVIKTKDPVYSMTSRHHPPGDATRKPGPGQHSPEKVILNKKNAPAYSFGIVHSQYTVPAIFPEVDES